MKNLTFIILTFFFSLQMNAQSGYSMSSVPGPKVDSLHSDLVGEDYRLLITLPFGFSPGKRKYPVLYYLDAFGTSGMMNELALAKMFSRSFDPVILVGISYETNPMLYGELRMRDYMPPINATDVKGGGDFLEFIKTELVPYMEKRYGADPENRGLMGYSLGGLFASWTLKAAPSLFQKLVIISPSLWFGDAFLFEDESFLNAINGATDLKVFIGCGSLESEHMISNAKRLFELFMGNKNIQAENVIFNNESHGSVNIPAMARGLYYLYENEYKVLRKEAKKYYKKQAYEKSLNLYLKAFEISPEQVDQDDRYDIACLYALIGNSDQAFRYLQTIADANFSDVNYLITDKDFNVLHQDKRWGSILEKVKQNKAGAFNN